MTAHSHQSKTWRGKGEVQVMEGLHISSISPCRVGGTTMSTYTSSECRRVSPSVHGNTFATAHRKKAVANIFDNDPEETKRALMALKQRKKDKFLQIAGMLRHLLQMR
ncbi:hypothetical protein F7725_012215 [Dissostichus mawsoni]|uniref:Arginine vasopressin-induced protein 1/transcriptional and immune response regulator domain-containing protein n=1 Tax=Dissostichus mawsoni TaxID=36200 RepID=A0A7J5YMR4_DISMA|nr:hypothetical protein F7725_012215 [Dissostichus mawsoni]